MCHVLFLLNASNQSSAYLPSAMQGRCECASQVTGLFTIRSQLTPWLFASAMPHRQRLAELSSASMDIRRALCVSDPRDKGESHQSPIRALPFKWIRSVYRCWKTRTHNDEAKYERRERLKEKSVTPCRYEKLFDLCICQKHFHSTQRCRSSLKSTPPG